MLKITSCPCNFIFYGIFVRYPITVHIGNFGAIFLSDSTYVCQQKKYIDVFYQFICDYVEYGTAKIQLGR